MTLQTVWHDNGIVKCVDSADSPAVIHGAEKATADTDVVGEITLNHVVTVVDGVVTDAVFDPVPPTTAQWMSKISSRADTELQRGVSVTVGGTTYGIRTGPVALALIDGGAITADRARRNNTTVTEKVPTDKGIVAFDQDGLDAIFAAVRAHRATIVDRMETLQKKVSDGTITEADLDEGWS